MDTVAVVAETHAAVLVIEDLASVITGLVAVRIAEAAVTDKVGTIRRDANAVVVEVVLVCLIE
jgi:hypothetical protein